MNISNLYSTPVMTILVMASILIAGLFGYFSASGQTIFRKSFPDHRRPVARSPRRGCRYMGGLSWHLL